MYRLYDNPGHALGGRLVATRLIDPLKRLTENLNRVVNYYRTAGHWVGTTHILVKLLTRLGGATKYDPYQYYAKINNQWHGEAVNLRMTTSWSTGKWHSGIFYHGCEELIFAYASERSVFQMLKDWKSLETVKVVDGPVSNLGLQIPDGKERNAETGLVFISVDVPALLFQWYCFCKERKLMLEAENALPIASLGAKDFVYRYVLPNMLWSQTRVALSNRLVNLQTGAPMGQAITRHTFNLLSVRESIDQGLPEILKRIKQSRMRYEDILYQLPTVGEGYGWEVPDMAETRQAWWALFLSRLKMTEFLLDAGGEMDRKYNGTHVNALAINLRRFRSDNVFTQNLPSEYRVEYLGRIKALEALVS